LLLHQRKTVTPTFTDAVDVIVDGTKLTTTGTSGWNSGIFSLESFSANGSVSATAASNSEAVVLGLSYTNEDANYNKINYAIFLTQTGNIDIYEIAGGATINTRVAFRITSYNANDTFSIERNDNTITYLKNGTVFYTAISAFHHLSCEFEPCSWRGVLDTTLCDTVRFHVKQAF
jgi:hypothetical protein